jgi:hypothetical protein
VKDRPAYRSYSQLDTWMTCGEQFRLQRRVGIQEKPSVWLPGGTAFHNTTEYIDHDTLLNGSIEQTWLREWDTALTAQYDKLVEAKVPADWLDSDNWRAANKGKENIPWWTKAGLKFCEDYAAWRDQSDLQIFWDGDTALIEAEMMPILNGVAVKMFADRIMVDKHGQLLVVDLKTGSKDIASSLQLGVYKIGVQKLLGVDIEWGAYYMARKGALDNPLPLNVWSEDRIASMFAAFDRQERAGEYLPNIGSHCKYMCSFRDHCVYVGGTKHKDDE